MLVRLDHVPVQLAIATRNGVDGVESLENFLVGTQAQGAQEDGAEELALAIDADVERVLLVVFELNPRAAVRNDLAEEIGAVAGRLKEDAGRTMQLRNDDALGAVDDERAVLRHQRNVSEEDFLFLDVADRLVARLRILVVDGEAHGDLERRRVGHAALFALRLVILQLQANRIAALVAEVGRVLVVSSALVAEHITGMKRIGDHHGAAVYAGGTQVMQTLQVSALALPVANRVVNKIQLRDVAKIGDWKDGGEHRLESVVFAFGRQLVHLQKAFIGAALNFNQVRDLDRRWNFGKIETAANSAVLVRHAFTPGTRVPEAPARITGRRTAARVKRQIW